MQKVVRKIMFALVLGFILVGYVSAQASGGRTEAFFRIFESGTYHMKARMISNGAEIPTEINARDGMVAATTTTMGMTTRMILRDNRTYVIIDALRMITVMPLMSTIEAGGVETNQMRFNNTGTAIFDGINLQYDEYSNPEGARVQYFVDGDRLVGIRSISGEISVDFIISELNQNVPNNVFDIPSGYRTQQM